MRNLIPGRKSCHSNNQDWATNFMSKVIAAVHAPGASGNQIRVLEQKLESFLNTMGFVHKKVFTGTDPVILIDDIEKAGNPLTLIIGWGLAEKPSWMRWAYKLKTSRTIMQFIALDLFEQHNGSRVLVVPNARVGEYWRHKSWQTNCKLFLKGLYVNTPQPYGLKRVPTKNPLNGGRSRTCRHKLAPGPPNEVAIVRLIFSLFVDHGYSLTDISNLLNAQSIKAPHRSNFWNIRKVRSIIESAVYIGSNQFGACFKHDVFPPLIDHPRFCAAQAKLYGKIHTAICDPTL